MKEEQNAEESTNEVRTVPKVRKFHANRFRSIGVRKDRAKNISKVLNLSVYKALPVKEVVKKTGLSERTVRLILNNDVVRSEVEKVEASIKLDAINTVRNSLVSKDEKTRVYAAKTVHEMLEKDRDRNNKSTAPVIDMTALVSSVASNLLAGAMLGIRSTLQDNSRSPATGTDEVRVLSTSMGNADSSSDALSADDEYVDPEQLNIPDEE
jgi:hypothetical protein